MLGHLSAVKCGGKRFSRYDKQWRFQIGKQIALIKLENVEKRFKNNTPGPDWVNISMKPILQRIWHPILNKKEQSLTKASPTKFGLVEVCEKVYKFKIYHISCF